MLYKNTPCYINNKSINDAVPIWVRKTSSRTQNRSVHLSELCIMYIIGKNDQSINLFCMNFKIIMFLKKYFFNVKNPQ